MSAIIDVTSANFKEVVATSDLKETVEFADVIVIAVPTKVMREVAKDINKYLERPKFIIHVSKGLEMETNKRMSEVISDEIDNDKLKGVGVLSGPSHAEELILRNPTVVAIASKNDELNDPLINNDHAVALEIVTEEELEIIRSQALKINELLQKLYLDANLVLVDFKIEFGKTKDGEIILADEISPDTCRLWDKDTNEKLDKDRFRRDLGNIEEAYIEVVKRLTEAK